MRPGNPNLPQSLRAEDFRKFVSAGPLEIETIDSLEELDAANERNLDREGEHKRRLRW